MKSRRSKKKPKDKDRLKVGTITREQILKMDRRARREIAIETVLTPIQEQEAVPMAATKRLKANATAAPTSKPPKPLWLRTNRDRL